MQQHCRSTSSPLPVARKVRACYLYFNSYGRSMLFPWVVVQCHLQTKLTSGSPPFPSLPDLICNLTRIHINRSLPPFTTTDIQPTSKLMTTGVPNTWTTLDSLILAQTVYKYGEDSWPTVSRTLKSHPALKCRAPTLYQPTVTTACWVYGFPCLRASDPPHSGFHRLAKIDISVC